MEIILVLGHKGMLGNAVTKYFTTKGYKVLTTKERWGTESFVQELKSSSATTIINCIGAIPQKKPTAEKYKDLNIDLPIFLETLNKKIIHPTTDCEFTGTSDIRKMYKRDDMRDANDEYGKSKRIIAEKIEKDFSNTKMIRVSIIGHELSSHISLLDWFLNSSGTVNGYTNHYWNGITTLQWTKLAELLINDWDNYPVLNQYGTDRIESKYEILTAVKEIYNKEYLEINPYETEITINKCLESDITLPTIEEQLRELKYFYDK